MYCKCISLYFITNIGDINDKGYDEIQAIIGSNLQILIDIAKNKSIYVKVLQKIIECDLNIGANDPLARLIGGLMNGQTLWNCKYCLHLTCV